jgi:Kef-type K+ transport system membrane component KefB
MSHGVEIFGALALVLVGARLGAALFRRLGQPEVLGELLVGVLLGNLGLLGFHAFDALAHSSGLDLLAEIGVLFLLFTVGLDSNLGEMLKLGRSSLLVAVLGVAAPMALGYLTSRLFHPTLASPAHWFVGATLCATSVGITARVLAGLKRTTSAEGRIILGAAVIDDVLGLVVLAVVTGVITAADRGRSFEAGALLAVVAKAIGFLLAALFAGRWLSRHTFRVAARIEADGLLLSLALGFCFTLSWLAALMGLAPIVGAFAAGLVLEDSHVQTLRERDRERRSVQQLIEPLTGFLTPIFFVIMGARVQLAAFSAPGVALFALVLTVAAVAGKQLCALGVLESGVDRVAVGLGMIPRGEVGLIFAGLGATLSLAGARVVDEPTFAAIVVMVALTTLLAPPLLAARLRRAR